MLNLIRHIIDHEKNAQILFFSNEEEEGEEIYEKYRVLLPPHTAGFHRPKKRSGNAGAAGGDRENQNKIEDSVTNRVAGFICKHVFIGHTSTVSCLALVEDDISDDIYLLSGGWDKYVPKRCTKT